MDGTTICMLIYATETYERMPAPPPEEEPINELYAHKEGQHLQVQAVSIEFREERARAGGERCAYFDF